MHQLARTKAEEEDRIAAVLQQRMHDAERTTKELQQLRNESAELRDLQVRRVRQNFNTNRRHTCTVQQYQQQLGLCPDNCKAAPADHDMPRLKIRADNLAQMALETSALACAATGSIAWYTWL